MQNRGMDRRHCRNKNILMPTDHYDVLALVALEPNVIQLVNATGVNKRTFRTKIGEPTRRTYRRQVEGHHRCILKGDAPTAPLSCKSFGFMAMASAPVVEPASSLVARARPATNFE